MAATQLSSLPDAPRPTPAGFLRRAAAAILDGLVLAIVILPMNAGLQLFSASPQASSADGPPLAMILATASYFTVTTLVSWLYPAWFYANKGATPGKMALGLEVVDADTGGRPGYGQTFMREVIAKTISFLVFMIGYLLPLFRSDGKALHDLMARTQVIRKRA